MSNIIVFTGPTLSANAVRKILPDAQILPPVQCGDVLNATRSEPRCMIIIDGFFENTLSVWHKEIIYAIDAGIMVIGASSMGALRAAELYPFGMLGVGDIYESYRKGLLTDDDEVAVYHQDEAHHYHAVSDAMVNIRATVNFAVHDGVLTPTEANKIMVFSKKQFYQQRNLKAIIEQLSKQFDITKFKKWFDLNGIIDIKKSDAKLALHKASDLMLGENTKKPSRSILNQTLFFGQLLRDVKSGANLISEDKDIVKYNRLYRRLKELLNDFPDLDACNDDFECNWIYYLLLINQDDNQYKYLITAYTNKELSSLTSNENKLVDKLVKFAGLFKQCVDRCSEDRILPSKLAVSKYKQRLLDMFSLETEKAYQDWLQLKNLSETNFLELCCYYFYYHLLVEAYNPHILKNKIYTNQ